MARAEWNGVVIAQSDNTVTVEGNVYFPPESINAELVELSRQTSRCPWKGTANYYDIVVDGKVNKGAAWYYPDPKSAAIEIKDRVAFWRGVVVSH